MDSRIFKFSTSAQRQPSARLNNVVLSLPTLALPRARNPPLATRDNTCPQHSHATCSLPPAPFSNYNLRCTTRAQYRGDLNSYLPRGVLNFKLRQYGYHRLQVRVAQLTNRICKINPNLKNPANTHDVGRIYLLGSSVQRLPYQRTEVIDRNRDVRNHVHFLFQHHMWIHLKGLEKSLLPNQLACARDFARSRSAVNRAHE